MTNNYSHNISSDEPVGTATRFFNKSQKVNVSRISAVGWWLGNTTEHVVKGTALGSDFTQNIYTPSKEGMTARYDRDDNSWSEEIKDKTFEPYWDVNGHAFTIGEPDGELPEWGINIFPPEYDKETHTVLYKKEEWHIYEILIGRPFYDEWGNEFLVSDYNFVLPERHSWEPPPEFKEGYGIKLINDEWVELIDHRGKMAYAKNRDSEVQHDYEIEALGELPVTHTLIEYQQFDSWLEDQGWAYDIERHRPYKKQEEKFWRDEQLTQVLNRIDQYEKDRGYPEEYRTSPIRTEEQYQKLLADRKLLSDYPESVNYPFGERPRLSGLA
ncbi:hypothetical protein RJD40_10695 [Vibrio scophthalmi]|uniref:hypothetical protein n=1 Tax=Vibrio scophthalmi TaxID=45658 RepID=UPI003AAF98DA